MLLNVKLICRCLGMEKMGRPSDISLQIILENLFYLLFGKKNDNCKKAEMHNLTYFVKENKMND